MNAMAFQVISTIGLVGILISAAVLWFRKPRFKLLLVPPVTWALMALAFYTALFVGILAPGDNEFARFLSAILRSVEITLILGAMLILMGRAHD